MELTQEQQAFIDAALSGQNVLVDACIGSGKTTAIQRLCDEYPLEKKILYLTYNRFLKFDARKKIKNQNVLVTNYHGFAAYALQERAKSVAVDDLINTFLKERPDIEDYDVLIIDEYQDIERDFSLMLLYIKEHLPHVQIIAVGDLDQKLYDFSDLDVEEFMKGYLGEHLCLSFTTCFRLSNEYASRLGKMWRKTIVGANETCRILTMDEKEVIDYLKEKETKDILCLGNRKGALSVTLNALETERPEKFNKKTVYSSIRDSDSFHIEPKKDSAIFTTYDSSKGLERDYVVVFDYLASNWINRAKHGSTSLRILKNIFLVAISRGKKEIVFVKGEEEKGIEDDFMMNADRGIDFPNLGGSKFDISRMFDFKYAEDIDDCYSELVIKEVYPPSKKIEAKTNDDLIDLSPCLGIYQEAGYFDNYDFDKATTHYREISPRNPLLRKKITREEGESDAAYLQRRILYLTALETDQHRYLKQVKVPFVSPEVDRQIKERLYPVVDRSDATQIPCRIPYRSQNLQFEIVGYADVVKNGKVYELKFVNSLSKNHFLQCACYMVALHLTTGILYNSKNDSCYEISINNVGRFLDKVMRCITKRRVGKYERVSTKFVVIDTETNFDDEVMPIGLVLSDEDYRPIDTRYYVIRPEHQKPSMYGSRLFVQDSPYIIDSRSVVISRLREWLSSNGVTGIFAYNASFDKKHLPELSDYKWFDIMRIASYKNHNKYITEGMEVTSGGRLVRNYGVECMIRLIDKDGDYEEVHNALIDAEDELWIMNKLERPLSYYAKYAELKDRCAPKVVVDSSTNEEKYLYSLESAAKMVGVTTNHLRFCVTVGKVFCSDRDERRSPLFSSEDIAKLKEYFGTENKKQMPVITSNESTNRENYFTAAQAARCLGISREVPYKCIKMGVINVSSRTSGGWPLFSKDDIKRAREFLNSSRKSNFSWKTAVSLIPLLIVLAIIIAVIVFFIQINM